MPDLEILAHVRYRDLRFEQVGTANVEFSGTHERETVWEAERENLPKPVQPGVTYRDGGVNLVISSSFSDLLRSLEDPEATPSTSPSPSPVP